ncbi:MAG: nucleotidyltransferase domain-containing protein, partial [Nanoarchaeota archaeon]
EEHLHYSREKGVFSREESVSKDERYATALTKISRFIGSYFSGIQNFSSIAPFPEMWEELGKYIRSPKDSTAHAKKIRKGLMQVFFSQQRKFMKLGVYPAVFGSVRYGDAGESSDVDVKFLVLDSDNGTDTEEKKTLNPELRLFLGELDSAIDRKFNNKHQIRDYLVGEKEMVANVYQLHLTLNDIIEKETTCFGDYNFNGKTFYPYNFFLESISLTSALGKMDKEAAEVKKKLRESIKADPFFELLMCLRLYCSMQKRVENSGRR